MSSLAEEEPETSSTAGTTLSQMEFFFFFPSITKTPNPPSSSCPTQRHHVSRRYSRVTSFHSRPEPGALSLLRRVPQKERLYWTWLISCRGFYFCLCVLDDLSSYFFFKLSFETHLLILKRYDCVSKACTAIGQACQL